MPTINIDKSFLIIRIDIIALNPLFGESIQEEPVTNPGRVSCSGVLESHVFAIGRNYGIRSLTAFKIVKVGEPHKILAGAIEF